MSNSVTRLTRGSGHAQSGFTLVELMVATTIAVFLLGGLFASLQSTRSAFQNQSALAQLQDNQRLAMTLMADVIESGGYYPNPRTNDAATVMPVAGSFATGGQAIFGTYSAAAPGDTVTIRFGAGWTGTVSDNVMNCLGGTNTTMAPYDLFVSKFHVDTATNALWCQATTANGTVVKDVLLVNGIQNMSILYGVTRNVGSGTGSCADTYLRADQMTNTDWTNVCSVRVTLTFTNTLNSVNANVTPITISRTIAVMSTVGANS
jgi:type IV pilus assembly protein PilW